MKLGCSQVLPDARACPHLSHYTVKVLVRSGLMMNTTFLVLSMKAKVNHLKHRTFQILSSGALLESQSYRKLNYYAEVP